MADTPSSETDADADLRRVWFRESILPHEAKLRDYVRRIGRGRIDVDDLVHDTLVRLISTQNWRQVTQPAAFMRTTARNLVIDALRREKVVAIDMPGDLEGAGFVDQAPDAQRTLEAKQTLRRLAAVVAALPQQQRRVFTLRKVYGLSLGVIADRMGLSVSTVEKHLVRSLRTCSERLAHDADPGPDPKAEDGPRGETSSRGHQRRSRPLGRAPR